jgi:hypothetical protein
MAKQSRFFRGGGVIARLVFTAACLRIFFANSESLNCLSNDRLIDSSWVVHDGQCIQRPNHLIGAMQVQLKEELIDDNVLLDWKSKAAGLYVPAMGRVTMDLSCSPFFFLSEGADSFSVEDDFGRTVRLFNYEKVSMLPDGTITSDRSSLIRSDTTSIRFIVEHGHFISRITVAAVRHERPPFALCDDPNVTLSVHDKDGTLLELFANKIGEIRANFVPNSTVDHHISRTAEHTLSMRRSPNDAALEPNSTQEHHDTSPREHDIKVDVIHQDQHSRQFQVDTQYLIIVNDHHSASFFDGMKRVGSVKLDGPVKLRLAATRVLAVHHVTADASYTMEVTMTSSGTQQFFQFDAGSATDTHIHINSTAAVEEEERHLQAITYCPNAPKCGGISTGRIVCWQYAPGLYTQLCACPSGCQYYPTSSYTCGYCDAIIDWTCPTTLWSGCGTTGQIQICHASNQGDPTAATYSTQCDSFSGHAAHKFDYCGYWYVGPLSNEK